MVGLDNSGKLCYIIQTITTTVKISQKGERMKKLYKGTFNNRGEALVDYVRADTEQHAYMILTARLGVALGITTYTARQRFSTDKQNTEIEEVRENDKQKDN